MYRADVGTGQSISYTIVLARHVLYTSGELRNSREVVLLAG